MYDIHELNSKGIDDLQVIAKELNIKKTSSLDKSELIYKILDEQALKPKATSSSSTKENQKKTTADKNTKAVNKDKTDNQMNDLFSPESDKNEKSSENSKKTEDNKRPVHKRQRINKPEKKETDNKPASDAGNEKKDADKRTKRVSADNKGRIQGTRT